MILSLGLLGMTPEEARQILVECSTRYNPFTKELGCDREVSDQAQRVWNEYLESLPGAIAARTGLTQEQVKQMIESGVKPSEIRGPVQYMSMAEEIRSSPMTIYVPQVCHPMDGGCAVRNEAIAEANEAIYRERRRQILYNTCVHNALLNNQNPDMKCSQYATPIPVPHVPGAATMELVLRETPYGEMWIPTNMTTEEFLAKRQQLAYQMQPTATATQTKPATASAPPTTPASAPSTTPASDAKGQTQVPPHPPGGGTSHPPADATQQPADSSIPIWAIAAGGLVLYFLLSKGK